MNIRALISTFCCLFIFSHLFAQRQNTYFFNNSGKKVSTADSADYKMIIIGPDSGSVLYTIKEYYKNGQPALMGKASSIDPMVLEGSCLYYFPNGQKKRYVNYNKGRLDGDDYHYFPNGIVYSYIKNKLISGDAHAFKYTPSIIASNDSTGKTLVIDGNGHFIDYQGDFGKIFEEGDIKDGKKDGVWKRTIYGIPRDSLIDLDTYKDGKLISSVSTDPNGNKKVQAYTTLLHEPKYPGGMQAFNVFLGQNIQYPPNARTKKIQGLVRVSFVVERDGSLTDVKPVDPIPDEELAAEAVRVIKLSPKWEPGMENERPVRVQYTVPVNFTLGSANK